MNKSLPPAICKKKIVYLTNDGNNKHSLLILKNDCVFSCYVSIEGYALLCWSSKLYLFLLSKEIMYEWKKEKRIPQATSTFKTISIKTSRLSLRGTLSRKKQIWLIVLMSSPAEKKADLHILMCWPMFLSECG